MKLYYTDTCMYKRTGLLCRFDREILADVDSNRTRTASLAYSKRALFRVCVDGESSRLHKIILTKIKWPIS